MTTLSRKFGFGNKLGLRLVIASLIVGSVLSIFSTGLQLGASYVRQSSDATEVLDRVDQSLTSSLERAVWTFNFDQVNIILDGISSDPNIAFLQLSSTTGQVWTRGEAEDENVSSDVLRSYDLVHDFADGQQETIATLSVRLSLDSVRDRIWAEFWTTFLTNLTKAYMAAAALLFLVNRMISRHLKRIVEHVDNTGDAAGSDLSLDRPEGTGPDDLDRIVDAVQRYEQRTQDQMNALSTEIIDRKQAETEAREALSIRSRFLATMSHEIRTPLNAIMGFLHLIENNKDTAPKPKLYAETATKAAHQLMNMMNNSLDMSRIDANAVEINPTPTDIQNLARDWHQTAEGMRHLRGKDIEITLSLQDDLPAEVLIDGSHVTQIMSNLLDNAIKFTDSGRVDIGVASTVHDGEQCLEIAVSDTGLGIPKDARGSIFERFTQAENGMSRAHDGAGLGLSICRELARLMGATLKLDDARGDGFATVFLLGLPNVVVADPAK